MREDTRSVGLGWLDQAQADWGWTQHLFALEAYYLVFFLTQQVAEKVLKAFLYAQGEEMVIGPAIRQLGHRAARYQVVFREARRARQRFLSVHPFAPQAACLQSLLLRNEG